MNGLSHLKQYRLKFYLNARHFIVINGKRGEVHPHTWEFVIAISFAQDIFTEFSTFEKGISQYLTKYQNQIINDFEPFDAIIPTIENITDYFAQDFAKIITQTGGHLERVEASETPTRTYIITGEDIVGNEDETFRKQITQKVVSSVLDHVLTIKP